MDLDKRCWSEISWVRRRKLQGNTRGRTWTRERERLKSVFVGSLRVRALNRSVSRVFIVGNLRRIMVQTAADQSIDRLWYIISTCQCPTSASSKYNCRCITTTKSSRDERCGARPLVVETATVKKKVFGNCKPIRLRRLSAYAHPTSTFVLGLQQTAVDKWGCQTRVVVHFEKPDKLNLISEFNKP